MRGINGDAKGQCVSIHQGMYATKIEEFFNKYDETIVHLNTDVLSFVFRSYLICSLNTMRLKKRYHKINRIFLLQDNWIPKGHLETYCG